MMDRAQKTALSNSVNIRKGAIAHRSDLTSATVLLASCAPVSGGLCSTAFVLNVVRSLDASRS